MSNNLPTKVYLLRDYFPNVAGTEFELKYVSTSMFMYTTNPYYDAEEIIYNTLEEAELSGGVFKPVYISKRGAKVEPYMVQSKEWFATKEEYQKVLNQREIAEAERIISLIFKYKPRHIKF